MSEKMPNDHTDPMWRTHMKTLTERMKRIEFAEIIDESIWQWYFENGKEVPNWKYQRDPQWWTDYLEELDNQG